MRLIVIAQAVVAVLLLIVDGSARWQFTMSTDRPGPEAPISPGDQVRHYDPMQVSPGFLDPSTLPDVDLPQGFPPRLAFDLYEDEQLGTVLLLNGVIEAGDADRLDAFLANEPIQPATVALNSPGGMVYEALLIGRNIRERGIDTLVSAGRVCVSSCPYILAGGVERTVSRRGVVGLHQHYYDTPGYLPVYFAVEDIQRGQGVTMSFLIEMGIDPGVMVYGLSTPPKDIYVLVEDELTNSRLANEIAD